MQNASSKAMFIYVSGPYSAPNEPASTKRQKISENIEKADNVAIAIANRGHFPFVPHTMMRGWEDMQKIERSRALNICKKWIEKCDAFYFIGNSEGTEEERQLAVKLNLPIYRHIEDIPEASSGSTSRLSSEAIQAYLVEYEQCMDSYRHTYATIWQAGAIFAAISAAIVTFAKESTGLAPWIQILAPIPVLFWWRGIFVPMNRYGERRNDRLVEIEELLSDPTIPGLQMQHFRKFSKSRKGEGHLTRFIKFKWLWQPRVVEIVTLFGFGLLALEIYLIARNYVFR